MKTSVNLEVHPAALLFPLMGEEELGKLADDIAANGLMEPVVLYHGQILDGRNRLAACELGGVEPRFTEVDGDLPSPTIYVLSKNLHRRHLSTSQRAAVAADVVPLLQEESHSRQIAGLKNQPHSSLAPKGANDDGAKKSTAIAADQLQVGARTVERALEVKRKDPELHEQIKRGELTVSEASRRVPKTEESTKFKKGKGGRQLASTQKERMVRALSTITGLCRGLCEELNVKLAISACDDEERAMWVERSKELSSQLRTFAGKLQKGF